MSWHEAVLHLSGEEWRGRGQEGGAGMWFSLTGKGSEKCLKGRSGEAVLEA